MQYFRNASRRMTECSSLRDMNMTPLCRGDIERHTNDIPEYQGYPNEYNSPGFGGCGCNEQGRTSRCDPSQTAETYGCTGLAMASVPDQEFIELNDAEEALCRGSLFRQLDMPFYGQKRRGCK